MSLKISRILHAGYVLENAGTAIAFDPIFENPFSRNCHAFPSVSFDLDKIRQQKFSAVFISHFHDDHCSFESLNLLDRATPLYVYCVFPELFELLQELGFAHVHSLTLDVPVNIGSFEVTARRAWDADVDSIFQIKAAGLNILNVVDSWIEEDTLKQLANLGPWDMVLWPFQTMLETDVLSPSRAGPGSTELPPEWLPQLRALNPRFVVPSSCQFLQESWSWYNHAMFPITYKQFAKEVSQALPHAQVVRLNPGVSMVLDKTSLGPSAPLPWVHPVGQQDVDYDYNPKLRVPTTAEVARHFAALTPEQTELVHDYCTKGLLEKYKSMDAPADMYFEKPRLWRLSIYDHLGEVQNFSYEIHRSEISIIQENAEPLAWTTEIPISKIYAALELGESLTSMYMRINEGRFEPKIESEIHEADLVDDPLIRCLFNGAFGSYQRAQLKRLQAAQGI